MQKVVPSERLRRELDDVLAGIDQEQDPTLALIWAVLELASRGWRGITMTPKAVAQIERIRRGQITQRRPLHLPRRSGGNRGLK